MKPSMCFAFLILAAVLIQTISAMPAPENDQEYAQEMSDWLNTLTARDLPQMVDRTRPCRAEGFITFPKRNSELINSLLGLPKNMNDVGK
ncbi:pigment-dispersing hormone peptides [Ctenocephalides felis]|uniref:pigment-dispersing hormone peptides n=1 Tax=Ctenocephalides felis TaxID=7515 RepID=UPI000E6E2E98|nr:pigment-dispersing hormone peptides [Ctenocephalides felis]